MTGICNHNFTQSWRFNCFSLDNFSVIITSVGDNMSNEYVLIQAQGDGFGQIAVSNNVINHIVEITVGENEFIYFDESVKKSLNVKNKDEGLFIDIKVRIQYGQNVDKICKKLQEELQRSLELMVEYRNSIINIHVAGFRFK